MTTARERPQHPSRREYRAGMFVRYDGRRWEVEAVEFWESDEKLQLRELDGAGRVRTREEWARNVEFSSAQTEPEAKVCPHCGDLTRTPHFDLVDLLGVGLVERYTCKKTEPKREETVCRICGFLDGHDDQCPHAQKPAPVAAPTAEEKAACPKCAAGESHRCDRYATKPAPVAGELPWPVRNAMAELQSAAIMNRREGNKETSSAQFMAADGLRSWARSQAQPVCPQCDRPVTDEDDHLEARDPGAETWNCPLTHPVVGMTPELERDEDIERRDFERARMVVGPSLDHAYDDEPATVADETADDRKLPEEIVKQAVHAAMQYEQVEIPFLCEEKVTTRATLRIFCDAYKEGWLDAQPNREEVPAEEIKTAVAALRIRAIAVGLRPMDLGTGLRLEAAADKIDRWLASAEGGAL